jgi:hypothetical protein
MARRAPFHRLAVRVGLARSRCEGFDKNPAGGTAQIAVHIPWPSDVADSDTDTVALKSHPRRWRSPLICEEIFRGADRFEPGMEVFWTSRKNLGT